LISWFDCGGDDATHLAHRPSLTSGPIFASHLKYLKLDSHSNLAFGGRIAALLAKQDPVAAAIWASQLPEENAASATAMVKITESIGPDAAALMRVAQSMAGGNNTAKDFDAYDFMAGVANLGSEEFVRLTAALVAQPNASRQATLVGASIAHLASKDSGAAFAALQKLPPAMGVVARAALCDAIGYGRLPDFPVADQLRLLQQMRADPPKQTTFADTAVNNMWQTIARVDPSAALAAIEANPNPDPGLVQNVFTSLAHRSPESAIAEIASLPEAQQANAAQGLADGWVSYDPMAASIWA
jgi:hypothetical protein